MSVACALLVRMHYHQDQDQAAEDYVEQLVAELVDQARGDVGLDQALGDVGLAVLLALASGPRGMFRF